ncbi:MAG: iron ABC transporter permease [Actinobacteria bacterium]|nr:iron ABC transporter permease [Actinomycetota bacterium]
MIKKIVPLILLLPLISIVALSLGATDVSQLLRHIFNPFLNPDSTSHQIIWQIRAPRVAAAILVGAALGIAGSLAQSSTNNPLADPAILGTSAGASLGVLIGVLTNLVGIGSAGAVVCAAVGAMAATLLTFSLARSALQLITIGIGVSAILNAIVGITLSAVSRPDARSISFWSFGSLSLVTTKTLYVVAPVLVIATVIAWKSAPTLDLLSLGDASVRHIGHNAQRIRFVAFGILAVLVAVTVSSVGSIAFLSLAAPHIARYLCGPRNRILVIFSGLVGALILLIADTAARSLIPPFELPIGLLTSLIGAPILIATLKKSGDVWR